MSEQLKQIKENVSGIFGVDIGSKSREEIYPIARAVYYKIARTKTVLPYKTIGDLVNRNHATVINGLKIFESLNQYPEYLTMINRCLRVYQLNPVSEPNIENTYALTHQVRVLKERLQMFSNKIHPKLAEVNSLPEDKLNEFIKYRVEPYLKMNV